MRDDLLSHRTFSSDSFSQPRAPATALPRPAPTSPFRPRRVAARAVRKKRRLPRFAATTRKRASVPSQDSNARTKPAKHHDQRIPRVFLTKTPPPPPWPSRASTFRRSGPEERDAGGRTSSRRTIPSTWPDGRRIDGRLGAGRGEAGTTESSPSSPPRRSRSLPTRRPVGGGGVRERLRRRFSGRCVGSSARRGSRARRRRRREVVVVVVVGGGDEDGPRVCSTATRRTIHPSRSSRRLNRARSDGAGPMIRTRLPGGTAPARASLARLVEVLRQVNVSAMRDASPTRERPPLSDARVWAPGTVASFPPPLALTGR